MPPRVKRLIPKFDLSKKNMLIAVSCLLLCLGLGFCQPPNKPGDKTPPPTDSLTYLNHHDSARYVGMNTCRLCHQNIYNTFIKTGMGKSFGMATQSKSSGDFTKAALYDAPGNLHYKAFWQHDSLYFKEYRLQKKDTIHQRSEQVNYIIGSGQHTNSHLHLVNGYLSQMPMTFYTQKKKWDLPPGFENGLNTRFSRKIGLECMSCHNAYPDFVKGSENKYTAIAGGIDCERCHGPGSIHVAQRQSGSRVDTSLYVDYSIVNPAKLNIDAQFDICQRCHLQGNAVLKEDKSFYDFKPGMKLSDYLTVFLPKYKNADDEFIMASHADRLKQSACFIKSYQKAGKKNALKPYLGALTCVTCHNPHVSVRETNKNVFNEACMNCHQMEAKVTAKNDCNRFVSKKSDCVSCHMPVSGSTDIPHVSVHDHYIRKPISAKEKNNIKQFIGLFAINEKQPDALTRAKAYINQYEKFEQQAAYLDSALQLLSGQVAADKKLKTLVQLYFIKKDFAAVVSLINQTGSQKVLTQMFTKSSYQNDDAWACYRVGEAFYYLGKPQNALAWFKQAVKLAPFHPDFRNKLGTTLAATGNKNEARKEFEFLIKENPEFVSAYSNLGYLYLTDGQSAEALRLYQTGEKLDPDNEALLLNLAAYYIFNRDIKKGKDYLQRVLKKNPANERANMILKQLATS
ncbi:MAG: tetratricopeptide repeat protein [Bacteroidia bacterium]|nr:tetratricopeptide repeat protein [Bacteroidia bacterium]